MTSKITVTATTTAIISASPDTARSPTPETSTVAAGASSSPGDKGYLAGDLTVSFPAGEPGQISVIAEGPRVKNSGTSWPIVLRNNTKEAVCNIGGTVTATSAPGKIVGSTDMPSITPAIVDAGSQAFGHLYFDTNIPDDSTIEFTFTQDSVDDCYSRPAIIEEVNQVPGSFGPSLVGKIRAPAGQEIAGPISVDILCLDGNGKPLSGGGDDGFADQDKPAAGQAGSFSVEPGGDICDQYLLGASGYAI